MGQNPVALAAAGVESECWARAAVAVAQRGVSSRSRLARRGLDLDDGSGWKAGAGPALCPGGCGRPDLRQTGGRRSGCFAVFLMGTGLQGSGAAGGRSSLCGGGMRVLAWRLLDWGWTPGGHCTSLSWG